MSTQTAMASLSLLPWLCLLLAVAVAAAAKQQQAQPTPASPPITLAGCPDKCGNVSIPYPFGTKKGCFRPGFFVVCNHTFHPPRPFINSSLSPNTSADNFEMLTEIIVHDLYYTFTSNGTLEGETTPIRTAWPVELAGVSLSDGKARLLGAFRLQLRVPGEQDAPLGAPAEDRSGLGLAVHAVGRRQRAYGHRQRRHRRGEPRQLELPVLRRLRLQRRPRRRQRVMLRAGLLPKQPAPFLQRQGHHGVHPEGPEALRDIQQFIRCSYAMIVEKKWYNFSSADLNNDAFLQRNGVSKGVIPFVVDFTIDTGTCPEAGKPKPKDFACISDHSECVDRQVEYKGTRYYYCRCSAGYEGNPYIDGGCQDINECHRQDLHPCHGHCKNTPGDYECSCPAGKRGNAKQAPCTDLFPLPAKISVGVVGGLFIIALLVFIILIRNEKRKMKDFFKKNGGPTLEKAKIIKIYKKEELNPILKRSNFIGRGAFGEVYKGFLDNQLVAVKKPIEVKKPTDGNDDLQNDQFANEVIIQSQVIHKNIVRLIGCCLEVDKPMLVYEFLPKGSLDDILHGSNLTSLTLECRLNIAAESAEGLAYLHSKTTNVILHGDVKPANILLDDTFTPKISDFGISRLIVIDKEHTDFVIGDRTYMDPVYLRDGLLTDKSDVYSFGVVLLELISRKKATYVDNNSLVRNFLDAHKSQKEATELFDKEIAKPEVLNLLNSIYEIAVNCLNLDVDKRPNMGEVAESLLMLKRSWSSTLTSHVPID